MQGQRDKFEHGFEGGVVTSQSPSGGGVHAKGTKVDLTVET
jgi:beta-lactam-binding protein with PASTA domain